MQVHVADIPDGRSGQPKSLELLAQLVMRGVSSPLVRATAIKLASECKSRDDLCELQAIFDGVKYGNPNVRPLAHGLKYVSDPVATKHSTDFFTGADATLKMLLKGINGGDCDDHSVLVASLAGALGFKVGLRGYGPKEQRGELIHVYAVAMVPKRAPKEVLALDTTVPQAYVGWEPPEGHVKTAWIVETE